MQQNAINEKIKYTIFLIFYKGQYVHTGIAIQNLAHLVQLSHPICK
jgi:hypothetical protein